MSTKPRIVIIGGGVIGAATAAFLARDHGIAATVVERDPSYERASSALSASSIRQQFSTAVNIALSRESLAYLRGIAGEIGLVERGYLYLAGVEGRAALEANHATQRSMSVDVALLDPAALRARFGWIATEGVALASLGLSGEGWFDGWSLLQHLRRAAIAGGARFVRANASRLVAQNDRIVGVLTSDEDRIDADAILVAAGAWSAPLLAPLGIALPVRARKRDVFVFETPAQLPGCPLVIDTSGVWFRPEGRAFIAGAAPRGPDLDDAPLDAIDHSLFDEVIWPALAARVPGLAALRTMSAWAGYYEMNVVDHNALVGPVSGIANLHVACGFSGHGMQHAPAVGRGVAAKLATGAWHAIDLTPLAPDRSEPLLERNIIG
jgi:FAD-dependent oxidoreductase domain-containing protein 1